MFTMTLQDLLKILDSWKEWKRLKDCPTRIEQLELELKALREQIREINKKPKGKQCPQCFESLYSQIKDEPDPTFGDLGARVHTYECQACKFSEKKMVNPR